MIEEVSQAPKLRRGRLQLESNGKLFELYGVLQGAKAASGSNRKATGRLQEGYGEVVGRLPARLRESCGKVAVTGTTGGFGKATGRLRESCGKVTVMAGKVRETIREGYGKVTGKLGYTGRCTERLQDAKHEGYKVAGRLREGGSCREGYSSRNCCMQ